MGICPEEIAEQTGTALCQYRVNIDQGDVSPADDTPTAEDVSPTDDTRVSVEMTPVLATSTDTHLDQRSEINPPKVPQGGREHVSQFEMFLEAYPRKEGRQEAHFVWHRIVFGKPAPNDPRSRRKFAQRATAAEILHGAQRFAAECRRKGTEDDKIPHAKTWLNAARWADYAAVAGKMASPAGIILKPDTHPREWKAWLGHFALVSDRGLLNLMRNHSVVQVPTLMPPNAYEAPL